MYKQQFLFYFICRIWFWLHLVQLQVSSESPRSTLTALLVDGSTQCSAGSYLTQRKVRYKSDSHSSLMASPGLLPPTQPGLAEPLLRLSPSTNSARICWAAATMTQQEYAESDSLHDIYTKGGVSSTSSARVCWASPDHHVQHKDSAEDKWVWLTTAVCGVWDMR